MLPEARAAGAVTEQRALRAALEAAQAEVARLTKELGRGRAPEAKKPAQAERLAERLEVSRRELDAHWREREREWQQRERALRDELDAVKAELAGQKRALARAERQARPAPRAGSLAHRGAAALKKLLPTGKLERELKQARAEIARLEQRLSVAAQVGGHRARR